MDGNTQRWLRAVAGATTLVAVRVGCGREQAAPVGALVTEEVADLTVVSDDRRVTIGAACIADIPADLSDCSGYRNALAHRARRDAEGRAHRAGGRRDRRLPDQVGGAPLSGLDRTLDDQCQVFRIPVDAVAQPGPELTVEALPSAGHPRRSGSSCSTTLPRAPD